MNSSNQTYFDLDDSFFDTAMKLAVAFTAFYGIVIVLGTLLNLWLLLAIATSQELRSRMRNKLLISTCVLHLLFCLVEGPLQTSFSFSTDYGHFCFHFYATVNIELMLDFVSNYTLLTMVIVFVLQLMDLKLSVWLSSLGQRLVTVGVILLPWVASLITIPAMIMGSAKVRITPECSIPYSYATMRLLDTLLPLSLAIVITVMALLKKRRRFRAGFTSSGMQVELLSPGPEMDEAKTYIAAVGVALCCDSIIALLEFELNFKSHKTRIIVWYIALTLECARPLFMFFPWLMFKDVRQRLKSWKPWLRPKPGIELSDVQSGDTQA
ncbi:uncharacterized protein LOC106076118 isoform X1 [Biomphalaria glabrata]|uniref:Uncharacterized protein LOC106076118 isoform X1 n=1 Tax=Biomphalaria glabrata TaxID=6526 RepID=A0A9W2ZIG4_BIOGL|nr:uncharacterized protein LOC106076118 isoform X1 [Biomphalaria glabrata]XP_055874810.1 uncharacterized protein LOC106076118 isoform X1 [Biomphalaria glabrata]KAI8766885.1 hypothetical protein BgiMline_004555 [Biomphalaria glabrata]